VCDEVKIFCTGLTIKQSRQNPSLVTAPTKEGPLPYVLHEFPFASVSTVSRSHPSLVSLGTALYSFSVLKGLSHEIDFDYVDEN
jgi:hypothetical protein